MTYHVVGMDEPQVYQTSSGVQVLSPGPGINVNGQYYLIGSQNVLGQFLIIEIVCSCPYVYTNKGIQLRLYY